MTESYVYPNGNEHSTLCYAYFMEIVSVNIRRAVAITFSISLSITRKKKSELKLDINISSLKDKQKC